MTPALLLIHGWGFGPAFWDAFRRALPDLPTLVADLGYFGPAMLPVARDPVVVIGHSTGALLALRHAPVRCAALVAINGFDHFVALEGAAGIAPRLLDRMISRLPEDPRGTIADFRRRCGDTSRFGRPRLVVLEEHLQLLRTADERERSAQWTPPLLHLSGDRDPILPLELRAQAFAGAPRRVHISHPEAGHLLPVTHPDWCAAQLRNLLQSL
jgi:pimeloyl-[acyl-carrier protein] methyl ester esterase